MKTQRENKWNVNLIIGIFLVSAAALFTLAGCFYTPYDPNAMNGALKNAAPSFAHPFGTDNFGRDILSRVMKGSGTTFLVGSLVVLLGGAAGTLLGAVTGYYGGRADRFLMRVNDVLTAFPSILLALVFVSVIGTGTYNVILALGIIFIPSFARVVRSEFLVQRELDYVKNAKLMGAGDWRIMFVHILPNTRPILLSALAIGFNNAVLAEAGLSYLGLGVQPPDPSLGRMLSDAQAYLLSAPWCAAFPGLMVVFTVLGAALLSTEGGFSAKGSLSTAGGFSAKGGFSAVGGLSAEGGERRG